MTRRRARPLGPNIPCDQIYTHARANRACNDLRVPT